VKEKDPSPTPPQPPSHNVQKLLDALKVAESVLSSVLLIHGKGGALPDNGERIVTKARDIVREALEPTT
jgi:hypothetical protein